MLCGKRKSGCTKHSVIDYLMKTLPALVSKLTQFWFFLVVLLIIVPRCDAGFYLKHLVVFIYMLIIWQRRVQTKPLILSEERICRLVVWLRSYRQNVKIALLFDVVFWSRPTFGRVLGLWLDFAVKSAF